VISASSVNVGHGLVKYSLDWTSDASGDVSGHRLDLVRGYLVQIGFKPDSGGTQPTDQYDVVLNDPDGVDILGGEGADLSNATATLTAVVTPVYYDGSLLDLIISNAGDTKGGVITLWFGPR
jgi:hypothetical protein